MDIRRKDLKGALEIIKTLPKKEQLDFSNNEYRKKLKLKDMLVLYIDNIPVSFIEVYELSKKDNYVLSMTKEQFRSSDETYQFRKYILDHLI